MVLKHTGKQRHHLQCRTFQNLARNLGPPRPSRVSAPPSLPSFAQILLATETLPCGWTYFIKIRAPARGLIMLGARVLHVVPCTGVGGKSVRQADVSGGTHFPRKLCPTGQDILSVLG